MTRLTGASRGLLFLAALLGAAAAPGQPAPRTLEGMGRVAVELGYRWTPNADFKRRAAEAGHELESGLFGGPQLTASFGYAAFDWVEVTIDILVGFETFKLKDYDAFTSTTYGGLLGMRLAKMDFPVRGLLPHLGLQVGPVLSYVTSGSVASAERFNTAYSINAGLTFRFADRWGVGFDVRYLFARGNVSEVATIDAGGLWSSLCLTYFIPPTPKDPLGGML